MLARLDNREIAAVFFEMADLLHIQGGDEYRIRAFKRSGRVIENLGEPLKSLIERNALQKVPGLGEGTVFRVKQILRSGSCDDLRRLKQTLPTGLREMLEIKGVGPRTVRIVWHHLKLGSVEELERAARRGDLAKLPRIGERTEEKILEGIAAWRLRVGRVPLQKARRTGDRIVQALRDVPEVVRATLGGSARRGKASVGDLDILVAADDGAPVIQAFTALPGVVDVLWGQGGDGRCSVRLESRQQVDLRIIPPENWGAGLHYFTGSQLHNIAIRARGNRRGVKISEHGVFWRHDETQRITPAEEEEEIFHAVGLPWIAPELRENLGEIEAAEAGRLPELITERDLCGDLHMHTTASDGKGSLREMADAAIALGHAYIAITDHSKTLEVANGLDERRLVEQGGQIRAMEDRLGRIRLLRGIEVDILPDGELDLERSVLRDLDWVVASVHSDFDLPEDRMTERLLRVIDSGLVDCIGHPTGRMLGIRDGYRYDMEKVLHACLRAGVAMEVNGSPKRMDLDDVHARQCRELGVMVAIDTDSHAPDHLAFREYGVAVARRGWLERKDVLNAWPVDVLLDRRRDRLRRSGATIGWAPLTLSPAPSPRPDPVEVAPGRAVPTQTDALAAALADPATLDDELLARTERWLTEGDDEALEDALRTLGDHPMQKAFELTVLARMARPVADEG